MRRFGLKSVWLLAGAALAATLPARAADPVRIGASLPLTGNFSVSGEKHRQGYQLCVELINERGGLLGRKIELIVSDNRSDTDTTLNQYERMINVEKVNVMFGTFSSKLTFPVSSVLAKNGMTHLVPSGGALRIWTQGHKGIFYLQPNAAEYVGLSLKGLIQDRIATDARPKKAAIVHADDFFANGVAAGLIGETVTQPGGGVIADLAPGYLKELGIALAYREKWPEEGFSDWLNLANSVKRSGADLVIALTASAEEAVQFTRALQTVRHNPKLLYLSQGTQAEFGEQLGRAANGALVHTAWHPAAPFESVLAGQPFTNKDFVAAFQKKHGAPPDEDSAIPFAVCQAMEQAVRATGETDNAKLSAWLAARSEAEPVRTVLGRFRWDERGLPVNKPFIMTQWQGGELKFVYPTDEFAGVSPLLHPKPQF